MVYEDLNLEEASAALGSRALVPDVDDHSSDISSSEAASIQNSMGSISPSPSLSHSKVCDNIVFRHTTLGRLPSLI